MTAEALDKSAWADLLDEAVESIAGLVGSADPRTDWEATAPGLEWSVGFVVEHVADDFVFYAGQLVRGSTTGWPPFAVRVEPDATAAQRADVLHSLGRVLSACVRAARPDDRGHHVYGVSGPRDYAAMGVVEALVHAEDLRRGLAVVWEPPPAPVEAVLGHLFARARGDDPLPGLDPWTELLTRCGRLGGPADWRWVNSAS